MTGLHRAAWPALGAAILFGASTPFAKQLIGDGAGLSFPFLLAGLLYLGSGLGLTVTRLVRDRGWLPAGLPANEWPWLLGAIVFGGVLGPLLLMVGLANTTAATASLFLNLEAVLTAVLAWLVIGKIDFGPTPPAPPAGQVQRSWGSLMQQPVFFVAALSAALGYGVMNLLMAATPLAMQNCGIGFGDTAMVLQWHVIGMFAPGFFTGHLIKRFGALPIMGVGVLLNFVCVAIALSGIEVQQFLISLLMLGVGWNFLFTGSTTLSMQGYAPED